MVTSKVDFTVVLRVKMANPNGDPLNENIPRMDLDTDYGSMSDVCIKRKIRDRLLENGENILIRPDDEMKSIKNRVLAEFEPIIKSEGKSFDKLDKSVVYTEGCKKWLDVRAFGNLFAYKGDSLSLGVKGPVTINPAVSVEPIEIVSMKITKSVNAEGNDDKKSSDTFGLKHMVKDSIYYFHGTINHFLSGKTGFDDVDTQKIQDVLPKLFENDESSARPSGSMSVLNVVWHTHTCPSGDMSSARIQDNIIIDKDGKISFKEDIGSTIIPGF